MQSISWRNTSSSWETLVWALSISALAGHQIMRKYDGFFLKLHASVVLLPPAVAAWYAMSLQIGQMSLVSTMALCYAIYLGALCTTVVAYRLSPFHPLYRYPGPFWCRTSMFVHAVRTTTGKQMTYLKALHERYGDVVRIGPNAISVRDASLVGPVLGPSGLPKSAFFTGTVLTESNIHLSGIRDLEEHAIRRRPWVRGLAPPALREYEQIGAARIYQLVNRLAEQKGVVILGQWFNYLAYDFMSDMAFGGGSELMRDGDQTGLWTTLEKGTATALFMGQVPWLGVYLGHIPGAARAVNEFLEYSREQAMKRLARGSITRDLFHYLANEDLPKKDPPPTAQLRSDGLLVILAGSDTTSSGLTSVFYGLMTDPSAYACLQQEVDRFYPPDEDVCTTKHHRDLHYVTAVINESLRLFPPTPTNSSREVPHNSKSLIYNNVLLPPGTLIHIPHYVLHRDPRNFVFPDTFWPERWLIASGQLELESARLPHGLTQPPPGHGKPKFEFVHNDAAFIPFSIGPMNCPGKGLAMQQMRMVICALVQRFRFRLQEGWDSRRYEEDFKDYFTANRPDLPVHIEPRY